MILAGSCPEVTLFRSNPGHPFCAGITLAKLAAVTTDDAGMETFVASGALDRLRKVKQSGERLHVNWSWSTLLSVRDSLLSVSRER
jgi:hypothetical protein